MDEQSLELVSGTTFNFELIWETEADNGRLQPVDITGCSVVLQVRNGANNELLLSCTSAEGSITLPEPSQGHIAVHIAPSKTLSQDINAWQDARWELRVTFPSDDTYSLVRGWATLTKGVVQ